MSALPTTLRLAAAICLSIQLPAAFAGDHTGKVVQIITRASDGLHYFYLDGSGSNKPACARYGYWMIKSEASQTGKDQFAMILSAMATGQTVKVSGANTCTRWSDGEDVDGISIAK